MNTVYTCALHDQRCRNSGEFGGKAAGLATLESLGLPVPAGFAVSGAAYRAFLDTPGLRDTVERVLDCGPGTDFRDAAGRIQEVLATTPVPAEAARAITRAYEQLREQIRDPDLAVAVRSSATAEDATAASFAGGFETALGVAADELVDRVHHCWSSVFSPAALAYAHANRLDPSTIEMPVVVQRSVPARAAGVMFTLNPTTGDRSRILIEANWGLGLTVVGGEVTPDRWVVDKVDESITEFTPGDKRLEHRTGGLTEVASSRWHPPCLTDDQVVELAHLGRVLERHHGAPQDIEFALEPDARGHEPLVLLQCRPETVWAHRRRQLRFDPHGDTTSWITSAIVDEPPAGQRIA